MNKGIAVSALLALAGSSYGFIVNQVAVQPGGNITPSAGLFVNYYSCFFCGPGSVVTDARATWKTYGGGLLETTWLASDPAGGGAITDIFTNPFSRVLAGPGADPRVPTHSGGTANWLGTGVHGTDHGLLNDGSAILGGVAGVSWGAGAGDGFATNSSVTPVNSVSVDSVFFGYFVMSDPGAVLTGPDLLVTIDGINRFLPLDGSKGPGTGGYAIEYETGVTPGGNRLIRGFVVIPSPGTAAFLGIPGLAMFARRRR